MLFLAEEIGDVIGAISAGRMRFIQGFGHRFRPVVTDQLQKFGDLAGERAVGLGQSPQVGLDRRSEQSDEPRLRLGGAGGRAAVDEFLSEALGPEGLTAAPPAGIGDDLLRS